MSVDRPIDKITETDLVVLITAGVSEGKTIEFKREINLSTPDAQRNFLANGASFANAQGGDIVFGMDADKGVAKAIRPLEGFEPDGGCIRLRDFIRAHIEPKLQGFQFQPVRLAADGHALVLRIPRTWVGAHMVTLNQDNRFYFRNGGGRCLMDVGEVRMAFSVAEALPERMRRLRLDRLSAISAGDVHAPLASQPILVFHIIPVKALDSLYECDLDAVAGEEGKGDPHLMPLAGFSGALAYDVDGLLRMAQALGCCHGYTKLFRNGYLEVVDCKSVRDPHDLAKGNTMTFNPGVHECWLLKWFPKWLHAMRTARLEPPAFVALSFVGMAGRRPLLGPLYGVDDLRPIRHDPLLLQPTLIESFDVDPSTALLPQFNCLWQACGVPRSLNFDGNGKWAPR